MRVKKLLHKWFGNTIHNKRIDLLGEMTETVLKSKSLSVTRIGRKLVNDAQPRSNIRKADRCYSNEKLVREKLPIYRHIAHLLIRGQRPILSVDESKLPTIDYYTLRATLSVSGRGLTVYETIYPKGESGSQALYRRFLTGLASVLPDGCCPILVTDAGFRAPWFQLVRSFGWDFVGRIRGTSCLCVLSAGETYHPRDYFSAQATSRPKPLGEARLTKRSQVNGYLYLYKGRNKGRHAHTRSGRRSQTEKTIKHQRAAKEGWVLFSSLKCAAKRIVKTYRLRMTIEESFRDYKSGRYGLGLAMTYSKQPRRYEVMLLIAMLAAFIAYLIGTVGEYNKIHYQFQASSTRHKRLLSRFFLGCEMVYHGYTFIYYKCIKAMADIYSEADFNYA